MQLQKHFDPIVAGLDERKRDQEGISTSFLLSVSHHLERLEYVD